MIFLIIGVLLLLVVIFFLQIQSWPTPRTFWYISKLPGPKGLPLLGMGLEIGKRAEEDLVPYLSELCNQYPRVMSYWLMGTPSVYIQKPEDLEILMGSSVHIKKGMEYDFITPWLNEGLLLSTGKKWQTRRKMLTPAFHFKILEDSLQAFNKSSVKLVANMLKTKGEPFPIEDYAKDCTLKALCESAMGVALDSEEGTGKVYVTSIKSFLEILKRRMISFWMVRDWMFYLNPAGFQFRKLMSVLHNFTDKVIEDRVNLFNQQQISPDLKSESKPKKAFLDSLIDYEFKNPGSLTAKDIREEVDTFMFEGHDTTSSAITFLMFVLGTYQDIQEKVVAELFEIFGDSDRSVEMKDLKQMEYLEKVIKETMRVYPPVPQISRLLTKDMKLDNDLMIPAGANCSIYIYHIHRNPDYFPDPEKFDPERFAEDEVKKRHPYSYIPFSAGPRNCIGQKFAMMELKVIISTLLRRLHVECVTKREDFKLCSILVLKTNVPIKIRVRPRESLAS